MDFKETGLPKDPMVYQAFSAYTQNVLEARDPRARDNGFALRTAQIIQEATPDDTRLISAALLSPLPATTDSIMARRFGAPVMNILNEARQHMATGYAYIADASEDAKKLCLAGAIASFEDFKKAAEKSQEQLTRLALNSEPQRVPLAIPLADIGVYEKMAESLLYKTSSPELEQQYMDSLEELKIITTEVQERLKEAGIRLPTKDAFGDEKEEAIPFQPLSFEETELPDSEVLRNAYDIVANNPLLLQQDYDVALGVAELLNLYTDDPVVLAAALIDVALPHLGSNDLNFLEKKLDPAVFGIIENHSVYKSATNGQLPHAPVEFKQIALANEIVLLEDMMELVTEIEFALHDNPETPISAFDTSIERLARLEKQSRQHIAPLIGETGLPEMEGLYEKTLEDLSDALKRFDQMAQPKPPKGPASGPGFI